MAVIRRYALRLALSRLARQRQAMQHDAQPPVPHEAPLPPPPPTLVEIFIGFLTLSLIAFGGALPLAHREIVRRRKWLDDQEFTDLLGLCQFLPGGNVINLSVAIGMKFRGVAGALAGLLGMILVPSLVVIGLGVIYQHTHDDPHVRHLFAGLAAAAAGLLVAMGVKIAWVLRREPVLGVIAVLAFVAIAILRVPLLPTMFILTPVSIFLASRMSR
jgi:chromate transporter